jgi:hypothetical protein
MKRWSWSAKYDEDPESVPVWFRLVRLTFWLIVVVAMLRSIWQDLG